MGPMRNLGTEVSKRKVASLFRFEFGGGFWKNHILLMHMRSSLRLLSPCHCLRLTLLLMPLTNKAI